MMMELYKELVRRVKLGFINPIGFRAKGNKFFTNPRNLELLKPYIQRPESFFQHTAAERET